jgi:hypothetical protein
MPICANLAIGPHPAYWVRKSAKTAERLPFFPNRFAGICNRHYSSSFDWYGFEFGLTFVAKSAQLFPLPLS